METPPLSMFLNCQSISLTPGAGGDVIYPTAFQATAGSILLQTRKLLLLFQSSSAAPGAAQTPLCSCSSLHPAPQPSFPPGEPKDRSVLCLLEALQGFQPFSHGYLSQRSPGRVVSVCWRPQGCCCCWNCSFSSVRTGKLLSACERGKN